MELTSLNAVKAWIFPAGNSSTDDDLLLTRLIAQVSGTVRNYLERPLLTRQTYVELRSGVGNQSMMLRNWPVVKVSSLIINNTTIPQAPAMKATSPGGSYSPSGSTAGWTLQTWDGSSSGIPQNLTLSGYCYEKGKNNVQITYDAGYALVSQPSTAPSSSPYKLAVQPAGGSWAQDDGVNYANGTALIPIAPNLSPTTGQYAAYSDGNGQGIYQFSAGDTGASILISYSYIPASLEQVAIDLIAERYSYRQRIGQKTQSMSGNVTASYDLSALPKWASLSLDGFKKFLPF